MLYISRNLSARIDEDTLFHISSCKKENKKGTDKTNNGDHQKHTVRSSFFQNLSPNKRRDGSSQSETHIKAGLSPDCIPGRQNAIYIIDRSDGVYGPAQALKQLHCQNGIDIL